MNQTIKHLGETWPVDLDECYAALQQLIEHRHTLHVPPERTDADMVLGNALKQLERWETWFAEFKTLDDENPACKVRLERADIVNQIEDALEREGD